VARYDAGDEGASISSPTIPITRTNSVKTPSPRRRSRRLRLANFRARITVTTWAYDGTGAVTQVTQPLGDY